MGWRNDKYDAFLMPLVQEYQQSHSDGKLKEFWTATFEAWFKLFPPKEPSADDIAKAGSRNKAVNAAREGMEKVSEAQGWIVLTQTDLSYRRSNGSSLIGRARAVVQTSS